MTFLVKKVFRTIQGEGHNAGRAAVFVRFAGCNMWDGTESGRTKGKADCSKWCDTDFRGGERLDLEVLIERIVSCWGKEGNRFVVFTGGEPALQLTEELLSSVRKLGFSAAVETNGSKALPMGVYWKTVSPKQTEIVVTKGHELKLIHPTLDPRSFEGLDFRYFYLQPKDDVNKEENTKSAIGYIKDNPKWRLSLQTHKIVGLP